jgi:hypothetical protein
MFRYRNGRLQGGALDPLGNVMYYTTNAQNYLPKIWKIINSETYLAPVISGKKLWTFVYVKKSTIIHQIRVHESETYLAPVISGKKLWTFVYVKKSTIILQIRVHELFYSLLMRRHKQQEITIEKKAVY